MVKVKDFCGAVFRAEEYENHLKNNIEHLEQTPMSKTFNTSKMIESGELSPEVQPFFYIYRQVYKNHTSYGILAQINIQDYHNNLIKRHQKTLHRPGLDQNTYLSEHVGPVVVGHRYSQQLNQMMINLIQSKVSFTEWTTNDGRHHTLWKIKDVEAALTQKFAKIENLYILDGHHRLQAAHQNFLAKQNKTDVDLWIQAIIYSSQYIMIHSQHRVLQNIPENIQVINQLMKLNHIDVKEIAFKDFKTFNINEELYNYEIVLKLYDKIYGITFKKLSRNVLQKITSFRLQNQIFKEFLDEEYLKKLKYVPGIIENEEIFKHEIVFFLKQPEIETLFQLADQSVTMPPKSTWIEPKPCSHMVIRLLHG